MLQEFEKNLSSSITHYEESLKAITVERITPVVLAGLNVKTNSGTMPLRNIAEVSILEQRKLEIKPRSNDFLPFIENVFKTYSVEHTLDVQKDRIICIFPEVTQDSRMKMLKHINVLTDQLKINLQGIRKKTLDNVKKSKLSENQEKIQIKEIENLFQKKKEEMENIHKKKEKDILGVKR